MKHLKFVCLSAVSLFILSSFILKADTSKKEEWIFWSEDKPIQWKDFKGKKNVVGNYTATITSSIITSERAWGSRVIEKTIAAYMNCNKSWHNGKDTTERVLRHEQYHFNITELYARKMRKELVAFDYTCSTKREFYKSWDKIFFLLHKEQNERQKKYDEETLRSLDESKQKEWEMTIDKELKELEGYTCSTYFIHLKDK